MIVLKFGGTSVGSSDAIRKVGQIVRGCLDKNPLLVVSAVGGITNLLFELRDLALQPRDDRAGGKRRWEGAYEQLRSKHVTILRELELEETLVDRLLDELRGLVRGISLISECTARTLDYLVSFGERLSARIVAAHLRSLGLPAEALDAFDAGLVTDSRFGAARPLSAAEDQIRERLKGKDEVFVITGYIAKNAEGAVTTLGRGGSDYSASIFGASLGAKEIQIWTDVDGVMTADPRFVKNAGLLRRLSFAEASELAFYGAKVIHPATMVPAVKRNIPIRVLNTYRPEFEGTTIVRDLAPEDRGVKSITSKHNITIVSIVAPPMALQYGFLSRIFDVFKRHEIVVDMIATSEVSVGLTTTPVASLEPAVAELTKFSEVIVQHGMAQVSVVGEEIRSRVGFAAEVFEVLSRRKVNLEMVSFGATRINLSFVVAQEKVKEAVLALHDKLFGERKS